MYKLTLVTVFILSCVYRLTAQEFGGTPPSVKWKQINNGQVRVIFPTGLDQQAKRIADISHYLNAGTRATIGPGRPQNQYCFTKPDYLFQRLCSTRAMAQ